MSDLIIAPNQELFFNNDLEITEVIHTLRTIPGAAEAFIKSCSRGKIDWTELTPSERGIILNAVVEAHLTDKKDLISLKALRDIDYVRTPPTPEEFITDPKYLGTWSKRIYPKWREELLYVLDPKNEIHEWIQAGSIGSGKCVNKNSLLFTSDGLLTIEEVYNNKIKKTLSETGLNDIESYHNEGITKTIKITTQYGYALEARPNHRIRVFDGTNIIWKAVKDLVVGDYTIITRKNNIWGDNPYEIDEDLARLWGIIIGDGCIRRGTIGITISGLDEAKEFREHVIQLCNKFNLNPKLNYSKKRNIYTVQIHNVTLLKKWADLGLKGKSWEKTVPLPIRMGTKNIVAAFLQGYFDTDGYCSKGGAVELTSTSEKIIYEIQQLLLNFGIYSKRKFKKNKYRGGWTCSLRGKESKQIFFNEINFSYEKKKKRLVEILNYQKTTWRHNDNEIIPASWETIEQLRSTVRNKGIGLKKNARLFAAIHSKNKQKRQNFTYKTLEQFVNIFGEQYLTDIFKQIYDEKYIFEPIINLQETETHCYDLTIKNDPSYISNGFISHNTAVAIIAQLYKLAVLSCLRNIPSYFNLAESTKLYFAMFTLSLGKAEAALASDFKTIIGASPYFRDIFPQRKNRSIRKVLNAQGDSSTSQDLWEVVLPQGLNVLLGSKVNHALSLAVISAILDEMSFRTKRTVKSEEDPDSAENVYNQIRSRIISRFEMLGHTPGLLCVISSKKTTSDFLEAHISKVKNDPHTHISSFSQWDVKPGNYSKEKFYVFVGNSKAGSRILTPGEEKLYPENSPNVIAVPLNLYSTFKYDLNSAIRELAGIATVGQNLLFEDPLIVSSMWDHSRKSYFVNDTIEIGLRNQTQISEFLNIDEVYTDLGFSKIPKHYPDMLRTIHLDLSKSNDLTGITMCGVSAIKEYVSKDNFGNLTVKSLIPEIFVDFTIGIKAAPGDQIDYEKIQRFINYLKKTGFRIHLISFDTYQSVSPMQMLIKDGFNVINVSTVRNDVTYMALRDVVKNRNISIPYSKALEKELINLIHDFSSGRGRVYKPLLNADGSPGEDDRSDSLSGAVYNCHTMLTDIKKYPDTANVDIIHPVIEGMYPTVNPYPNLNLANSNAELDEMNNFMKKLIPSNLRGN